MARDHDALSPLRSSTTPGCDVVSHDLPALDHVELRHAWGGMLASEHLLRAAGDILAEVGA